jgi:NTP pyrophosphatase (non-canonical NTP hydrolase)
MRISTGSIIHVVQTQVRQWSYKNFGSDNSQYKSYTDPLLGISEEVGELCHAHLKRSQGIRTNEDYEAKIKDALGDIFIYMCDYANRNGINLASCIENAWNEVSQRDWTKNKENGTVNS